MSKKSHLDMMIDWFKANNGFATLYEVLHSGEPWSHEFNARKTNLHQKTKYKLVLERGKRASENLYRLQEIEPSGQIVAL